MPTNFTVHADPLLNSRILQELMPMNFKVPLMEAYDGFTDPNDYLDNFCALMLLH